MRFAQNGYYIEKYLKCANCGLLIYGNGIHKPLARQAGALLLGLVRAVEGAAQRLGRPDQAADPPSSAR